LIAELPLRGVIRLVRRHPFGAVLLGPHLLVKTHFLFHLPVELIAPEVEGRLSPQSQ
jgi:hypothetical protein